MNRPQQKLWMVCAVVTLVGAACVEGDLPNAELPDEPAPRTEVKRPNDPTTDAGLPYDLGRPDQGPTPDMTPGPDMPSTPDMTPDLDPGDPCAGLELCTMGTNTCMGSMVRSCIFNGDGCAVYGPPMSCPGSFACSDNDCRPVSNCIDADGDGYGAGCQAGPDCRDDDNMIYPGAAERCDGVDNNCNNLIDEGFPGVGQSCSAGQGACQTTGLNICGANGQVVCDAVAGMPSMEVCDGLDNDCNGVVDDNMICPVTPCADDPQEPNDTAAQAFSLNVNAPVLGRTCASDKEFFKLNVTAGQTYRVNLAFPHSSSDLDMVLFENGAPYRTADSANDHEQLQFTAAAGKTYTLEVQNYGAADNFYRLSVTDSWACGSEDAFEKNDAISIFSYLIPGWRAPAYLCRGNRDFYYLGEQDANKTITVNIYFTRTFLFNEGDLDMVLYRDDDNDGTYQNVASATADKNNDVMTYSSPVKARYAIMVYGHDYALDDAENDYELRWSISP